LFVPAKTPRKIVERLSREAAAAVKHPEVSRKLIEMGAEPVGSSAAAHDDIFKRQMNQFRPVIREIPYFPALAGHVKRSDLDFVQVHYSIQMRLAEDRILPAAMDKGTAVLVNMPFEKARLFSLVQGRPLPSFAKEIACENWAQYFLKWVISHPAITCVIPATSNPVHQAQNIGALRGHLPDKGLRSRMLKRMESILGFDKLQETPPYPGKSYQGLIRRAINARTAVAR